MIKVISKVQKMLL